MKEINITAPIGKSPTAQFQQALRAGEVLLSNKLKDKEQNDQRFSKLENRIETLEKESKQVGRMRRKLEELTNRLEAIENKPRTKAEIMNDFKNGVINAVETAIQLKQLKK